MLPVRASHRVALEAGRIGTAAAGVDQVTPQNAALVEEAAVAAQSLDAQARQLVTLMSRFKLRAETA